METDKPAEFTGEEKPEGFLIVGIGASAGGIQALQDFFQHVPEDSGMAYVVILHLSPDHDSQLAAVLQRETKLPVAQVTEKTIIQPDHVYVVPPNRHLTMEDGFIAVTGNIFMEERRAPVGIFFRTLADEHGPRSVAVILSGTGANGSMGLKRIKERGGACFVQNPREAEFNEMPRNAIATELVDEVLNVAAIPPKIVAYRKNLGTVEITEDVERRPEEQQQALREIFTQLRIRTGHDFSNYKRPTLLRRIERRINLRNLTDLPAYSRFLQDHPGESMVLLKDLLISVTNFFRDKKAFEMLEQEILPAVFKDKTAEDEIRIWVAGCATGEEAYSVAMLCTERILGAIDAPKVQIFATDIDESAIMHAREGLYLLNDAADVSPERLRRFFNKEGDCYRVRREIRELILFATHNFLKDPPFSHLDLVTCRNVMIYLNTVAQERVVETFHFALNPGGYLFLGSSESVDGANDLYAMYSRENHIYQSRQVKPKAYPIPESTPALYFDRFKADRSTQAAENKILERISFGDLHQQLLEEYAPPSVVINEEYDILHLTERAGKYLQIGGGELSQNLLKLVKPELRLELRSALYQAIQRQSAVEARGLKVSLSDKTETINIHIRPVLRTGDMAKGFILVLFEPTTENDNQQVVVAADEPIARHLEEELVRMKAQLRAATEQHDFQAEEMKASNEELQAMNEELRSAAEELETSKEELQSINEELRTVNQELKVKIEETSLASNNLQNLINSTDIGTIFLDRSFRVVLYTPAAGAIFNLIPADHGRPITDITHRLEYNDLLTDAETVLDKLNTIEKEIRTRGAKIYLMRLTPYRTDEDRIKGVVLTFVDITERRAADEALRRSEERFRAFVTASSDVVYRMSADWSEMLNLKGMEFLKDMPDPSRNWLQKYIPEKEQPRVHAAISEAIRNKKMFVLEHQVYDVNGTVSWTHSRAVPTLNEQGEITEWFGAASDITQRIEAEKRIHEAEEKHRLQLEQQVEERTAELKESNDLLRSIYDTSLYGMSVMKAERNEKGEIEDFRIEIVNKELERETGRTDLVGKLYSKEYPGVREVGVWELLMETMETGEPTGMEYYYDHEGFNKWYACQFIKLDDGVVATNVDITERKKAEAESIVKQSLLQATMDSSLEMVQVFEAVRDESGTIVDFRWILNNHASEKIYGDVIGKSLLTLNPGVAEEGIFDTFKEVAETGRPVIAERHYMHEQFNGWFYQSAVKLGDGVVTTTVDITERKEAEQKIVEEQRRLKDAQSIGAIGSFEWNFGAEYVTWSDEMYRINGLEPQSQAITVDFTESLVLPQDLPALLDLKEASFATPGHYELQHRIQLGDGTIKCVTHRFESIADEAGNVVRVHGTLQDVTRQKNAEQELLRVKEELAQRAADKYLQLFTAMDEGFCIIEVLFDGGGQPLDYRLLETNKAFERQTTLTAATGKTIRQLLPRLEQSWFDPYGRVAQTGLSERFESFSEELGIYYEVYAFRVDDPDAHHVAVLFNNITERKQAEERQAYLLKMSDALRSLSDTAEMYETITQLAMHYFKADRCYYYEVEGDRAIIKKDARREGLPSVSGEYDMSKMTVFKAFLQTGEPLIINDVNHTDLIEEDLKQLCLQMQIISFINLPVLKNKQLVGRFCITQSVRRIWTNLEIDLAMDTAERTWAAVERAKAEQALQQSEEKFRTMAAAAPALVWTCAPTGENIYFNERWYEFTGQTKEEAAGSGWTKAVHPDDWALTAPYWERCQQTGEVYEGEVRYRRYDGEYRWFSFRALPVYNAQGAIEAWHGLSLDVTERKNAEDAVRKSEERLQRMVNVPKVGVLTFDYRENMLHANDAFLQMVGYSREEVEARPFTWREFTPAEHMEASLKVIEQLEKTGMGGPYEKEYYRKDGSKVWMMFVAADLGDGTLVEYAIDVSDRKATEEALRASEVRLHLIFESVKGFAIFSLTTDGMISSWNAGATDTFGWTKEEVMGGPADLLFTATDRAAGQLAAEMKAAAGEGSVPDVRWHLRKDGSLVYLNGVMHPLYDAENRLTGFVKIGRDMTDQHNAETALRKSEENYRIRLEKEVALHTAELKETNIALRYANENLQQFATIASHDLQEPLRKLKLFASVLRRFNENLPEEGREVIQKISATSGRMSQLIREVLEYSRIAYGAREFVATDLNAILQNVVSDLDLMIKESGAEIEQTGTLPQVEAIPPQMNQLFYNLLSNALKYRKKEVPPRVRISCAHLSAEEAAQYPELKASKDYIEVVVADNGIGFDQEFAEQIFQIFERLHSADEYEGTGVGLALCKKIVENHSGHVFALSEEGVGSSFYVLLPVYQ